jgi:hypothetical protein
MDKLSLRCKRRDIRYRATKKKRRRSKCRRKAKVARKTGRPFTERRANILLNLSIVRVRYFSRSVMPSKKVKMEESIKRAMRTDPLESIKRAAEVRKRQRSKSTIWEALLEERKEQMHIEARR